MVSTFTYIIEFLRAIGFFDIILPGLLIGIPLCVLSYRLIKYKFLKNLIKPPNVLNTIVAVFLALVITSIIVQLFLAITNILPVFNTMWVTINWVVTLVIAGVLIYLLIKIDFKKR